MGAYSGFSILPKDTSACRFGRLEIELPTFRLGDDHSTPQPQPPAIDACSFLQLAKSVLKKFVLLKFVLVLFELVVTLPPQIPSSTALFCPYT